MRQGELLGLTWGDVDRSRGVVLPEVTKSGKRRELPLCGPPDAVLARRQGEGQRRVFGGPWSRWRTGWERALEAARLDDVRFHDLRHTFASWTMQAGASLPELQQLLGHASLAMTMRYAHLSPKHLRSAISRLDDVLTVLTGEGRSRAEEMVDSTPSHVSV
jgi:integrase